MVHFEHGWYNYFCFERFITNDNKVSVVGCDKNQGQRSHFTDNIKSINSLREFYIRHYAAITVKGNVAEIFMTVYGLSEKELSKE